MNVTKDDCVALSIQFRLGLQCYDLVPTEFLLSHLLCLLTLDRGEVTGRLDPREWAVRIGMVDAAGPRAGRCLKVVKTLICLGILDVNFAQGTFELRPCVENWSRTRAFRGASRTATGMEELPLRSERPVSEALSELSREQALKSGPSTKHDWPALFSNLRAALQAGPEAMEEFLKAHPDCHERSPENSGNLVNNFHRKIPSELPAENSGDRKDQSARGFAAAPENSSGPAIASSASLIQKAKLATAGSAKVGEAWAWLSSEDRLGQLMDPRYGPQWRELCERDPLYVLKRLKGRLDHYRDRNGKDSVGDPIAWMSRKAREERQMRTV